ncbi:MAG: hypothetical protein MHM6MM_000520 [Cercozoa sp. M6MM]
MAAEHRAAQEVIQAQQRQDRRAAQFQMQRLSIALELAHEERDTTKEKADELEQTVAELQEEISRKDNKLLRESDAIARQLETFLASNSDEASKMLRTLSKKHAQTEATLTQEACRWRERATNLTHQATQLSSHCHRLRLACSHLLDQCQESETRNAVLAADETLPELLKKDTMKDVKLQAVSTADDDLREKQQLRESLETARAQVRTLTQELAQATAATEEARQLNEDLRQQKIADEQRKAEQLSAQIAALQSLGAEVKEQRKQTEEETRQLREENRAAIRLADESQRRAEIAEEKAMKLQQQLEESATVMVGDKKGRKQLRHLQRKLTEQREELEQLRQQTRASTAGELGELASDLGDTRYIRELEEERAALLLRATRAEAELRAMKKEYGKRLAELMNAPVRG